MTHKQIAAIAALGRAVAACLGAGVERDTIIGGVAVSLGTVLHEAKTSKRRRTPHPPPEHSGKGER